jgi:transcriptional regulator of acetoin/glycerol metabolism
MSKVKIYQNEAWLRKKYLRDKLTLEQIAEEAGVSRVTIWRQLNKYGMVRERKVLL